MSSSPAAAAPAATKVAALEPNDPDTADGAASPAAPQAALPMPPRRPGEFMTASIPLPPTRPVQLAALISAPAPHPMIAYAAQTPPAGAAALRSLIEATQGPLRDPRRAGLPSVITEGTSNPEKAPNQTVALAYAPAGGGTTGLRAVALGRPYLSKEAAGRKADFVPARLDRSNFRALTGSAPAARMTTQSVLGPAVSAPRAASRADFSLLNATPSAGFVTGFGNVASDLPTTSFNARGVNMARASTN
jgi:hypothetical protein